MTGRRPSWWLALRIAAWAAVLPALKLVLPVTSLARLMWRDARVDRRDRREETRVLAYVDRLYRRGRVPRRHNCLERSLITYRFLSELNANPVLTVAMKRDHEALRGHAWVVVDGNALAEHPQTTAAFAPVIRFGSRGTMLSDFDEPFAVHSTHA